MIKSKDLARSREEKFCRLFNQIAAEYCGEVPEWLEDYCQACAYGNNQQFMKAVNTIFALDYISDKCQGRQLCETTTGSITPKNSEGGT